MLAKRAWHVRKQRIESATYANTILSLSTITALSLCLACTTDPYVQYNNKQADQRTGAIMRCINFMEANEQGFFRFWRSQLKNHVALYERQRPVEVERLIATRVRARFGVFVAYQVADDPIWWWWWWWWWCSYLMRGKQQQVKRSTKCSHATVSYIRQSAARCCTATFTTPMHQVTSMHTGVDGANNPRVIAHPLTVIGGVGFHLPKQSKRNSRYEHIELHHHHSIAICSGS
jgi:hypothetical protein